ncbi:COBRA-like protein 7 [Arachis ipaensis]|uniref:COBRA-like protein 7 n=1 Tax=Arachis ipaensis TaxID=130454 RepID=UPI0007AFCF45|nr:COBRA-like protein 7 [Arachis ipaensis]XP_029149681.1 COBRA-like protein 7 [Arachis hypogaea]
MATENADLKGWSLRYPFWLLMWMGNKFLMDKLVLVAQNDVLSTVLIQTTPFLWPSQHPVTAYSSPTPTLAGRTSRPMSLMEWILSSGKKLDEDPFPISDVAKQPYRFKSTLTVLNNGLNDLKSWKVFVKFQHNEFLVFASGVVLAVGTTLPATIGNGTIFAGYPMTDLKIAVETTSDLTQMQDQIDLVGTVFGMAPPTIPLPSSINVANDGFIWKNVSNVCCTRDPKFKTNIIIDDEFLRHHDGDLSIMYDAIGAYDSNYWAEVTIANHNPLGRLDNWKLSWDWMNDEFIYSINGAYLYVMNASDSVLW